LASQEQSKAAIAEAATLRCKLPQLRPDVTIVRSPGSIAIGLRMQVNEPTGPPLRVTLLTNCPSHSTSPQDGRQKHFPSISFSVAASSIDSASSRFSRRFSSSRAFSLRASEISIPPNLDRHL